MCANSQRYPFLYPYLLKEISTISATTKGVVEEGALFPVLLVLAKLQPSPNPEDYPVSSINPKLKK